MKPLVLPKYSKSAPPAAFGRLCVETIYVEQAAVVAVPQPPSGGCVLKQAIRYMPFCTIVPAAFGRLCVETFAVTTSVTIF